MYLREAVQKYEERFKEHRESIEKAQEEEEKKEEEKV